MALPVIVTNFSGPSAYLRPGHAYSIGVAAALNKDGTAEPLITDLIASFRRVAARPREASMVGVRARRWVQTHLSTEVVARRKENIMSSLQQRVEGEHVWAQTFNPSRIFVSDFFFNPWNSVQISLKFSSAHIFFMRIALIYNVTC